ncbi:MAG: protein-export chaperone SecB [Lentimicrobium sp.]
MNSPEPQPAIRLIDFLVSYVQMDIKNPFDPELAKSLEVNVGVSIGFNDKDLTHYTINFDVTANSRDEKIRLQVKSMALFETSSEIDTAFKSSGFVQSNSPAIAFPFVRSYINTLTSNAGIRPIILPAFNFTGNPEN